MYTHQVYLLLGTNLGDRKAWLSRATVSIAAQVGSVMRQSAVYETAPWGVTNQPAYLNQVLAVETQLTPEGILHQTQAIEEQLGRVREQHWGPRIIDIDILYYDHLMWHSDRLTVPHPYLHQRRFTLVPLVELAPNFLHPVLNLTNQALLAACADTGEVIKFC